MRRLKTFCVVAICVLWPACRYREIVGACSAFDKQGDAAMVTLEAKHLTLQFSPAAGGSFSLSSSLSLPPLTTCNMFFSGDSRLVAVGINTGPNESLRVVAADVPARRWAGDFTVPTGGFFGPPLTLLGFAPGTSSLVVLGTRPINNINTDPMGFSTALIDVPGRRVNAPVFRALPDDAGVINLEFGEAADVKNNRLWFDHKPDPCPLRSVPLLGDGPNGPTVGEGLDRSICDELRGSAFPDGNTMMVDLFDSPEHAHFYVWRVDLQAQTGERLQLPNDPGWGNRLEVVGNLTSPDGEIVAVLSKPYTIWLLGAAESPVIDLIQVKPFKFLRETRFSEYAVPYGAPIVSMGPPSFSIYHANGAVTIQWFQTRTWFWSAGWQRRKVKVK